MPFSSEPVHENRQPGRVQATTAAYPPPKLSEPLPCPRCNSTNTKFCYYNNYNLSQPRHFCKSCRRYWTHGGTLRDIPVGGGSRKSSNSSAAKRARSSGTANTHGTAGLSSSSSFSCTSSLLTTTTTNTTIHEPEPGPRLGARSSDVAAEGKDGNLIIGCGSFASLLSGQSGDGAFLALGNGNGLGYGFNYGFDEMSNGYSNYLCGGGTVAEAPVTVGGETWQVGEMEGNGGDSFLWPGLEISMQDNNVK